MVSKKEKKLAESVKSLELRVTKRKAPPPSVLFWVFDIGDRRLRRRVGDNGMSRDCIGRVFIPRESIHFNPTKLRGAGKGQTIHTVYVYAYGISGREYA